MNSTAPEGILLIDKPTGITSHDVVDIVRRKLGMKRVGHAGTLDPLATGLLIILVGRATKASQYLMSLDKEYEATMKLGESTDSQDSEGLVTETKEVPEFTQEQIVEVANTFLGDQYQMPPMFSAKKVGGVPLYKLARKGKEVERKARFIRISELNITRIELPNVDFFLKCSKGTYVRTITHDIGQKLECGAHMTQLRRIATDQFRIEDAIEVDAFKELSKSEINDLLIPTFKAVPAMVKS